MRKIIAIVLVIVILVIGICLQTIKLHSIINDYSMREINRNNYNSKNYTVSAELYAVTPDGIEVLQDINGKLWEVPDLHITRHDCLILEIKNDELSKVMIIAWTS